MADQPAPTSFDALCLEVLKAIGKTLGQMNLYSASHPAVKAMMTQTVAMLSEILPVAGGAVAYSLDGSKVIANGRIVGQLAQLPNSIPNAFNRFKLSSITFRAGITVEELSALCQLAALRADAAKGVVPSEYLAQQGVGHISLNEAVYTKVDKRTGQGGPEGGEAGGGGTVPGASYAEEFIRRLDAQPLEQSVETLVRSAAPDPGDQTLIKEAVMRRIRQDLEKKVAEATVEIRRQKNVAENTSARTQAVLGNISAGVVVVDDQGKVLMMNPEAEELFGTKMSEAAGKPLTSNVKDQHMLALSSEIQTPADRPVTDKVDFAGSQDARRTLRASTAVVQNEAGKPVGMVSALSDHAKHREMEKMEREFVAHVTHELRAPLTSIRAALEILQGTVYSRLEGEEKRMMDNALRNTDRLEDLIKGILDFSKIESGQMRVHPKPCAAEEIAREAVESLRPWAQRKGIELTLTVQEGLPQVDADSSRSVQIIVNLISNAIKFTPKGGAIKAAVAAGEGENSKFAVLSVSDTGSGIPKEEQTRIFEKFVQIASGETHVGGTGLGLAIAKALVHLQRGQMWLKSSPGAGSTFFFTLPHYVPPPEFGARAQAQVRVPWWKRLFGLR